MIYQNAANFAAMDDDIEELERLMPYLNDGEKNKTMSMAIVSSSKECLDFLLAKGVLPNLENTLAAASQDNIDIFSMAFALTTETVRRQAFKICIERDSIKCIKSALSLEGFKVVGEDVLGCIKRGNVRVLALLSERPEVDLINFSDHQLVKNFLAAKAMHDADSTEEDINVAPMIKQKAALI